MKTAQEYFNTIPFIDIDKQGEYYNIPKSKVIEAMKEFAQEACREQREICAGHYNHYTKDTDFSILFKIKNAPEPKMI